MVDSIEEFKMHRVADSDNQCRNTKPVKLRKKKGKVSKIFKEFKEFFGFIRWMSGLPKKSFSNQDVKNYLEEAMCGHYSKQDIENEMDYLDEFRSNYFGIISAMGKIGITPEITEVKEEEKHEKDEP
jgi:hypothetical protein